MEFINLKSQQNKIRDNIEGKIKNVLDHGQFIMGPEVFELEDLLAKEVGVKHCVSCSSGTDALLILLLANNIGVGDAILTTPFTYIATSEAISLSGATPVFVDINKDTFNIDPFKIEKAMALAKELTNMSLPEIGDAFGGRDHTTVLHAQRKVQELVATDARVREDYQNLQRILGA